MMINIPLREYPKRILEDRSARGLLAANLLALGIALYERWDLGFVLVVYWWQNVIIGAMNAVKLVTFPIPEMHDSKDPSKVFAPKQILIFKVGLAAFFLFHYGFFHFGYYSFLKSEFRKVDGLAVFLCVGAFFLHHLLSYLYNFKRDVTAMDFMKLFAFPYFRILPMHLTIIVGTFVAMMMEMILGKDFYESFGRLLILTFFLLLKTKMDLDMHFAEHDPHFNPLKKKKG
ncbi:MAG: hypothetical protein JW893_04865 [Candidatus Omnitrophica bacterium]|nr:hypothetical protein [Candidatus Omnitrophota bacterium]